MTGDKILCIPAPVKHCRLFLFLQLAGHTVDQEGQLRVEGALCELRPAKHAAKSFRSG